ncbi:MAG: alkaline phosphatase D family protein [Thermomicrobiales bacterium]
MNNAAFERLLKRRTSRRLTVASGASGLIGLSFAGNPTKVYARQSSADGTPDATPTSTLSQPSAQFGAYPFQLGVASGDPLANSVILWTRLAPSPIDGGGMDPIPYDVSWELATDEGFGTIVQSGTTSADPNLSHSIHLEVTGLDPATEYFYRFMVGSEVSQVGRTKTAPAIGQAVPSVRFGYASCSNYEHGYFVGYRAMAEQNLDVILHLGDYIYEYGPDEYHVREPENFRLHTGAETLALRDYRNRFALYRTDPDLQLAHASAPWVVTWDDHEVENNYADLTSENNDSETDFALRRADAYQAYYEHMPLRPSSMPVDPDLTLYRKLNFGDLLEFQVLDSRQYRTDQPAGDGEYPRSPASIDPSTTLLGPDQERWLLQNLSASTATWNVMAQQILMAETYFPVTDGEAQGYYTDSWGGYPSARERILSHLLNNPIANPVILTGDIHTAWANDIKADWEDNASRTIATEYVTTSITAGGTEPSNFGEAYRDVFSYIKYFDGRHGGFTVAEVTAESWKNDFYNVDNMEDFASPVTLSATYITEAGNPGAQEG